MYVCVCVRRTLSSDCGDAPKSKSAHSQNTIASPPSNPKKAKCALAPKHALVGADLAGKRGVFDSCGLEKGGATRLQAVPGGRFRVEGPSS